MEKLTTLNEVQGFFSKDRFATENGVVVDEVSDKHAICSLVIGARHRNALGGVMGGVPFMLADFAFAVATNHQGDIVVSLSSNISFCGVAKGEKLIAEAKCVKDGRSTCYYIIDVKDELDNMVAVVTINGFKK